MSSNGDNSGRDKRTDLSLRNGSEEVLVKKYTAPSVKTYTEEEIFEVLGPARTYNGHLPTEL